MLVILSQKVDSESEYADELFTTYHYPAHYRNQLRAGDVFVYYQGNRFDKTQRYYFGTGVIKEISTADEENYYAKLSNCSRFERKVPIYLPDGGYIEQLGYQEVRKSINPPWQSSIRPLSEQAYKYVMKCAGIQESIAAVQSVDDLKEQLKKSVRSFYIEKDESAILEIRKTAEAISEILNISVDNMKDKKGASETEKQACVMSISVVDELAEYCRNMKMSYSYKPVLIMALINASDENWNIRISEAAEYFKGFYKKRRDKGLPVELKKCIYQDPKVTVEQITSNLIANPVKALVESGFFEYYPSTGIFSLRNDIKRQITKKKASEIHDICSQKLAQYYLR
jgi:hypothetical protein